MTICDECKKEYIPNKYSNKKQHYCSKKCAAQAGYRKRLAEHPYVPKERPELGIVMICKVCGKEFMQNPKYRKGIQKYCSANCQARFWRESHPDKAKESTKKYRKSHATEVALKLRKGTLKRKYGITLDEYNDMLKTQNGKCAICHEEKNETLCVDHDHKTGKVRGLLCTHCNHVVGFAKDNIKILDETIKYLDK